ncbi:Subtilisin-like protein [Glarea lozoyensis ATCC 20868]|uniref:Subtilisin-like protein n=1 Tax=Glarea lozoyensis (strain ATCC 20868 / MF5171) TaxID=1116229 RepID=S3D763_GLAL2|nr:Subtilisin-like protein [Glarea lozoyensis ATCC 20868]EPE32989.1 Subtilisin-like protein [Glarea lozoyensis ATCC 20868]
MAEKGPDLLRDPETHTPRSSLVSNSSRTPELPNSQSITSSKNISRKLKLPLYGHGNPPEDIQQNKQSGSHALSTSGASRTPGNTSSTQSTVDQTSNLNSYRYLSGTSDEWENLFSRDKQLPTVTVNSDLLPDGPESSLIPSNPQSSNVEETPVSDGRPSVPSSGNALDSSTSTALPVGSGDDISTAKSGSAFLDLSLDSTINPTQSESQSQILSASANSPSLFTATGKDSQGSFRGRSKRQIDDSSKPAEKGSEGTADEVDKPSTTLYHISPKKGIPQQIINEFTEKLEKETDPGTLWTNGFEDEFVVFWAQYLTPEQESFYKTEPAVETIKDPSKEKPRRHTRRSIKRPSSAKFPQKKMEHRNESTLRKRTRPVQFLPPETQSHQHGAVDDLKMVSQPDGVDLADIDTYSYHAFEQPSSRVYVIDSGCSEESNIWADIDPNHVEWLHPGGLAVPQTKSERFETDSTEDDSSKGDHHGTKILSKLINDPYGTGRSVDVTIVRLPKALPTSEDGEDDEEITFCHSCLYHAYQLIFQDIRLKMATGGPNAYVNMRTIITNSNAIEFDLDEPEDSRTGLIPADGDFNFQEYDWLSRFTRLGVVVTVSSGSNHPDEDHDKRFNLRDVPAVWSSSASAASSPDYLPLIVVGACGTDGTRFSGQPYLPWPDRWPNAQIDVYAPAYNTDVSDDLYDTTKVSGSSYAAPVVAGMIANFYNSEHMNELVRRFNGFPQENRGGLDWVKLVRDYVRELSWERTPNQPGGLTVNLLYNGENPLLRNGAPACQVSGQTSRRQDDQNQPCVKNDPQQASSTSVTPVASVTSVESVNSVASASPEPLTSASTKPLDTTKAHHVICKQGNYTWDGQQRSEITLYTDYDPVPRDSDAWHSMIFPKGPGHVKNGPPNDEFVTDPNIDPQIGSSISGKFKDLSFTFVPTVAAVINLDAYYMPGKGSIYNKWNQLIWDSESGTRRLFDMCLASGVGFSNYGNVDPRLFWPL